MRQIVAEIIVRKHVYALKTKQFPALLRRCHRPDETPPNGKIVDIDATIIRERDSHKGIIIGKQGAMLKKIGKQRAVNLAGQMLEQKVNRGV